jgi:hypothetical protein
MKPLSFFENIFSGIKLFFGMTDDPFLGMFKKRYFDNYWSL